MTKKIKELNNPEGDYEVGFKKPPKETRFTKGQSGNPNGRPKGKKNMATILLAAANELVTINENGKSKQVTKFEAACKQTLNKSAGGDLTAIKLLMQLMSSVEAQMSKEASTILSDERDQAVVKEMLKRLKGNGDE